MEQEQQRTGTVAHSPPAAGSMMRAIVQDAYGSADVLRLARISPPEIAASEVLLRVHAAGLDRGAWHLMTGRPYLLRLVFGIGKPKNPVRGREVAGTVVAVGPAVTRFSAGDDVYGIGRGTFAEYAAAPEDKLARKPASATFEQAAVAPVSALTALQALTDAGRVKQGDKVLLPEQPADGREEQHYILCRYRIRVLRRGMGRQPSQSCAGGWQAVPLRIFRLFRWGRRLLFRFGPQPDAHHLPIPKKLSIETSLGTSSFIPHSVLLSREMFRLSSPIWFVGVHPELLACGLKCGSPGRAIRVEHRAADVFRTQQKEWPSGHAPFPSLCCSRNRQCDKCDLADREVQSVRSNGGQRTHNTFPGLCG